MPKAISLFTGGGGSDVGLHTAGFEVVFANDVLPYARDFYLRNLPETDFVVQDIGQIDVFPDADLLVGCYPCQGFSQGGARKAGRKVNYLYREFDRALRQIRPKAFIVENVPGMRRSDLNHLLQNQVTRFRLAGYRVRWKILNSEEYGVSQQRRRLFIVGLRSDLGMTYAFPDPTHGATGRPFVTIRDSISHLPLWPEGEYNTERFHWYYLSRNRYRDWDSISKTVVAKGRHVPLHPVSPKLLRVHTDKWVFEHAGPARRFSFRECAILQGFSRHVEFPDTASMNEKYKVVGNAVPPPLFEAVVRAIPAVW
ncbi:MAG: DNA (cytosine-5-)-methyltransferase [Rhodobacteraceae bacterium]|nr:DNA (cytosine-5-)-methyltransferase [Paracoccaceae bacterium]MCY4195781.1 DNA (cytosine-5-)-methyltransferase [Paracoccaceae bacterium]MCY4327532.1 DNA (cytosine-5-)-methyltransferase [Paracoccaceae bacterium]